MLGLREEAARLRSDHQQRWFITGAAVLVAGLLLGLIVPALASRRFTPSSRIFVGYGVGVLGYVIGLIASALTDLPTGATIVVALAAVFAATLLLPAADGADVK